MAQSVEHILGKDEVPGSNPGISFPKALKLFRMVSKLFCFIGRCIFETEPKMLLTFSFNKGIILLCRSFKKGDFA